MVKNKGNSEFNEEIVKVLLELRGKIACVSSEKAVFAIIDDFIGRFKGDSRLILSEHFKAQFLEDPMECTKHDFVEFMQTDDCRLCGSQRCSCDPEEYLDYAKSCGAFKDFLKKKKEVGK